MTLAGDETVWDQHRGKGLPDSLMPDPTDIDALDRLGQSLRLSKWRPSTRISYDRWFQTWVAFASVNGCAILPASSVWFARFLVLLGCHYAQSTVQIAAAAVIAVHRFNQFESPSTCTVVTDILASLRQNGRIGMACKKFIIDPSFVVQMSEAFLSEYPVWDASLFNPLAACVPSANSSLTVFKGMSVACMRGVAIILLGLAVGLRAGEVCKLTLCCWRERLLESVFVHVKEAKNGNIRDEAGGYLYRDGKPFSESFSAISYFEEFWFPFLESMRLSVQPGCTHNVYPTLRCKVCPPMFPTFPKQCQRVPQSEPWYKRCKHVSTSEVSAVVKQWAAQLGLDATQYSAISFRRGSVSIAAAAKVARNIRQRQCRWKLKHMQDYYTEVSISEALQYGKALSQKIQKSRKNRGQSVDFRIAKKPSRR